MVRYRGNKPVSSFVEIQFCHGQRGEDVKLMAQWKLYLHDEPDTEVEIWRGMIVTCMEGYEIGKVAAVAVSQDSQQALCLILSHLPQDGHYQSLPVSWIERVEGCVIFLSVSTKVVQSLPAWHTA